LSIWVLFQYFKFNYDFLDFIIWNKSDHKESFQGLLQNQLQSDKKKTSEHINDQSFLENYLSGKCISFFFSFLLQDQNMSSCNITGSTITHSLNRLIHEKNSGDRKRRSPFCYLGHTAFQYVHTRSFTRLLLH